MKGGRRELTLDLRESTLIERVHPNMVLKGLMSFLWFNGFQVVMSYFNDVFNKTVGMYHSCTIRDVSFNKTVEM